MKRSFLIIAMIMFTINCAFGQNHWSQVATFKTNHLHYFNKFVFAATDTGLYVSPDWGNTWNSTSIKDTLISDFTDDGGNYAYLTSENGVFRSFSPFINWQPLYTAQAKNGVFTSIKIYNNIIWAGALDAIYFSSDNGSNWSSNSNIDSVNCMTVANNALYIGTTHGLYKRISGVYKKINTGYILHVAANQYMTIISQKLFGQLEFYYPGFVMRSNDDSTWTPIGSTFSQSTGLKIHFLYCDHTLNNMEAMTVGTNTYAWYNQGQPDVWNQWLTGETGMDLNNSLCMTYMIVDTPFSNATHCFVGSANGILKYDPTGGTAVEPDNFIKRGTYKLYQNYPNPFNPSTTINYSIQRESKVMIKIYNLLGQELKTLVNTMETAGKHQITFNAEDLPSGIYLYRIQAGDFVQTKKMILLK